MPSAATNAANEVHRALEAALTHPTQTAMGLAFGLVFGFGFVLLARAHDERARSSEDAAQLLGLPLLGRLPSSAQTDAGTQPYDALRVNLEFANLEPTAQVIMVTSPAGTEWTSATVGNLAVGMALPEARRRRRPRLSRSPDRRCLWTSGSRRRDGRRAGPRFPYGCGRIDLGEPRRFAQRPASWMVPTHQICGHPGYGNANCRPPASACQSRRGTHQLAADAAGQRCDDAVRKRRRNPRRRRWRALGRGIASRASDDARRCSPRAALDS